MTHDEKIVESHRLLMSDIVELKALADEAAEQIKTRKDKPDARYDTAS